MTALRCKSGDLVVIVKAGMDTQNLLGRITTVRMVSPYGKGDWVWTFDDAPFIAATGRKVTVLNDCALRPLRDRPGVDETLRVKEISA